MLRGIGCGIMVLLIQTATLCLALKLYHQADMHLVYMVGQRLSNTPPRRLICSKLQSLILICEQIYVI